MSAKFAEIRAETLMLPKLVSLILFILVMHSSTGTALAAARTGDIAVMDLRLATPLSTVDNDPGPEVRGTISIFENHGTPLTSNGELDLAWIRTGTASLTQNIEIKRRGSSSLSHPKKNYSLDLRGGASPVLGMPAETEWVMHSCWADKTCLRNLIGYWQAAKLFAWAPRTEFAEVFINDEYRGLYLIIEKVKLGPNRVNSPPVDTDITGTYIFKRDGNDDCPLNCPDWRSAVDPATKWWFVQPKQKDRTLAHLDHLRDFMNNTFESMFKPGSPSYDPANYRTLASQSAAVNFVIIQEMANNADAYWKSMHVTKQRDNRLYMGPIWDLDLAFANAKFASETCRTDNWRIETSNPVFQPLREMWKVPAFRQALKDGWYYLRYYAIVSRTAIDGKLTDTENRIAAARARDNKKWDTIGKTIWEECTVQPTYHDEVVELKRWMRARIDWIDSKILNDPGFLKP